MVTAAALLMQVKEKGTNVEVSAQYAESSPMQGKGVLTPCTPMVATVVFHALQAA